MLSGRSTPKPAHASQDDCTLEFAGCRGACARGLGARAALGLGTAADVSKTGACAGTALAGPSAGLTASGAIAAARDGGAAEDVGCGGVAGAEAAATGAKAELMPKWVMRDRGEAEGASTGCAAGAAEAAAAGESAGANGDADTGEVTGVAWAA